MSEHPELSRLPSDERYWDQLETRVLSSLEETAVGHSVEREWWAPLAERAYAVGALALAAGIAAILLLPARAQSPLGAAGELLQPPADDAGLISPLAAESPPPITLLVFPGSQE